MISKEAWFQLVAVRPIRLDPKEVKRATEDMWDQFMEYLEGSPGRIKLNDYLWNPHMAVHMKVVNVKGKALRIPLVVFARPADGTTVVNGFITLSTPKKLAVNLPIGGVAGSEILQTLKQQPTLARKWRADFASTIAHELTHAKDLGEEVTYDFNNPDREEYVNDPMEVRAFMQQIAREVAEIYPTPGIQQVYSQPVDKLEAALDMSDTWRVQVGPYLSEANRRKVITGVVNYLRDLELL